MRLATLDTIRAADDLELVRLGVTARHGLAKSLLGGGDVVKVNLERLGLVLLNLCKVLGSKLGWCQAMDDPVDIRHRPCLCCTRIEMKSALQGVESDGVVPTLYKARRRDQEPDCGSGLLLSGRRSLSCPGYFHR